MSLEKDITAVKSLMEADIFKAPTPQNLANRKAHQEAESLKQNAERLAKAGPKFTKLMEFAAQAKDADDQYIRLCENEFLGNYGRRGDNDRPTKISFSIKIYGQGIPDDVREKLDKYGSIFMEDAYSTMQEDMQSSLIDFMDGPEGLMNRYKFITGWSQEGRSGGWLVLEIEDVNDSYDINNLLDSEFYTSENALDTVEEYESFEYTHYIKKFADYIRAVTRRMKDLTSIEARIEKGKRGIVRWFASKDYWDNFFERYSDEMQEKDEEELAQRSIK